MGPCPALLLPPFFPLLLLLNDTHLSFMIYSIRTNKSEAFGGCGLRVVKGA